MLAQLLVPFAQALSFWLAHQLCRDVLLYVLAVVLSGIIYCRPACLLHGTLEVHGEGVGGRGGGGGSVCLQWLLLSHIADMEASGVQPCSTSGKALSEEPKLCLR